MKFELIGLGFVVMSAGIYAREGSSFKSFICYAVGMGIMVITLFL